MAMKRVQRDGKTLNQRTLDMLECAEARLGLRGVRLYVIQGSYNSGVSQSAGTHDGGGAIDTTTTDHPNEVVRALREVGFAAWHRTPDQGPWNAHIHAIALGDPEASSGAKQQMDLYRQGYNGLANGGKDDGPRLDPIPRWPIKFRTVSAETVRNQFKAKKPSKRVAVRRVQRILNKRLNLDLTLDGVAGPKTRDAWKRFENRIDSKAPDGVPGDGELSVLLKGYYKVATKS